MILNRYKATMCIVLFFIFTGVKAQSKNDSIPFDMLELEGKMLLFMDKLNTVAAEVKYANLEQLEKAEKEVSAIDSRWNLFSQAYQLDIVSDEQLLNLMTSYQEYKQSLSDTIQSRRHMLESFAAFNTSEKFIRKQKEPYQQMQDEAKKYAQVEKLAPMLEKLKLKEQLLVAEIDKSYELANAAAQEYGILKDRMKKLEESYIELKRMSESIQAQEYKPLIERIKDYLLSFAAVAIILMFINMVQSKIQAYKQLKQSAEEYQKAMQGSDDDIPSI